MTRATRAEHARTRPAPRLFVLAFLSLLIYGAGANVGAGTVLLVAAGMAVGTGWSVTGFLRRVHELRVRVERAIVVPEGPGALMATVTMPRGVIGVIGVVIGTAPDQQWSTLPRSGTSGQVRIATVLGRGDAQQLHLKLEVTDAFGLVRRRWTVTGPVAHVVPAHGAAAAFGAATVEGVEDDLIAHALAANGTPGTELRPWRPGEAIRAVHWPASERAAQLLVRPRAPETGQRRTLAVEDRVWTRECLDVRCRDLAATADRLVQAGVEVEVAAGGQVVPWGHEARLLLASLPPNASTTGSGSR